MPVSCTYDIVRIGTILSDISRYFKDLEDMKIEGPHDLQDARNFYAASMILFSVLNRVFDLGSEVVIARHLGVPQTYREIFTLLEREGILIPTLAHDTKNFVTWRNLLSHEYQGITPDQVYHIITETGTIRAFVECLQNLIEADT